jgi:uncharacterized protein YecE (DUF72 family)
MIRIGCSGWAYDHWRNGVFYPARCATGNWLAYYARYFDTVEINSTFYRLPKRSAVDRWLEQTPESFSFAVKASRYLTHIKRLRDLPFHLDKLLERIEPLSSSPKCGPLLWQLPPTFKRDEERLEAALVGLPEKMRHAFEFRHESWFRDSVYELLRHHQVALVIADRPEIQSFQSLELTAGFTYLRFHSGSHTNEGRYSSTQLAKWAKQIRSWSSDLDVYAYFNNDWQGYAVANALELAERLALRDGLAKIETVGVANAPKA